MNMIEHPVKITEIGEEQKTEPLLKLVEPEEKYFFITPDRANLFLALAKAQGEIDAASKTRENDYFTSKYSDIHDISQAVKIPLANNDLFYSQMWIRGSQKNEVRVVTIVGHKSGEYMQIESGMICKDFENPQKMGSVISYTKRYQLAGMLGVTSTEKRLDDDASIATIQDQSDPKVLGKLTSAAKEGQKSFTTAWKSLPVKNRTSVSASDLSTLRKLAKENETGNARVAPSTSKTAHSQ